MKKLLLAMLLVAALPLQAGATTYYLNSRSVFAKTYNAGTSATAPAKTSTQLNSVLLPGDVVRVYPGVYAFPNPDSAGSNPTGYITYIGTHPTADPLSDSTARAQILFNTEGPAKPYLSIKGITIGASLHFGESSDRDSVRYCTVTGDLEIYGGDYNKITECSFRGTRIGIAAYSNGAAVSAVGNTVQNSNFWRLGVGLTEQPHFFECGKNPSSGPGSFCDSLTFQRNWLFFTEQSNAGDVSPWYLYRTRNSHFDYNHVEVDDERILGQAWFLRLRDSTYTDTFRGNTFLGYGPGNLGIGWSTHGGDARPLLDVWGCTADSNLVNLSACGNGSDIQFQDWLNGWTITNNTFAARGYALQARIVKGRSTIDHNTLIGDGSKGVVDFQKDLAHPAWGDTAVTFTNNIIQSWSTPGALPVGGQVASSLVRFDAAAIDSSTSMHGQKKFIAHHNLYGWGGPCDIAILNGNSWVYSTPGDSTATNSTGRADNRYRVDSLSIAGSPAFAAGAGDSTQGLAFNPALSKGSPAIGAGTSSSDIGAKTYVNVPKLFCDQSAMFFVYGTADTIKATFYNVGDGTLHTTASCNTGLIYQVIPQGVQGFVKPGAGVLGGVSWDNGGNCDRSDPSFTEHGCAIGDLDTSTSATVTVIYDGLGSPGIRNLSILCDDPSLPSASPSGCTSGHYFTLPIIVQ